MRLVALVALVSFLVLPNFVGAANIIDDCAAAGPTGCQKITPDGAPPVPGVATYYLWIKGTSCLPSGSGTECGRPCGCVDGLVYQETNSKPGLQRFAGTDWKADTVVLI